MCIRDRAVCEAAWIQSGLQLCHYRKCENPPRDPEKEPLLKERIVVLVTLDIIIVTYAINSARWSDMLGALENIFWNTIVSSVDKKKLFT